VACDAPPTNSWQKGAVFEELRGVVDQPTDRPLAG
jgi:hypothetical protein